MESFDAIGRGKKSIGVVGPIDSGRNIEMNTLQRRDANSMRDTSNPSAHAERVYSAQCTSVDSSTPHSSAAIRNDHVPPRVARVSRAS